MAEPAVQPASVAQGDRGGPVGLLGVLLPGFDGGPTALINSPITNNLLQTGGSGRGGNGGNGGTGGPGGTGGQEDSLWGGGIQASNGSVTLTSSPVTGNRALGGATGAGGNGGIGTTGVGGAGGNGGRTDSAWGEAFPGPTEAVRR